MASGGRKATKKSSGRTYDNRKGSSRTGKGTSTKKKNTKSTGTRKVKKGVKTQKNQLKDEICVLIALACSVIFILSNFNLAGSVGKNIKWFMFGMVGILEYILPVVIAGTIIFLIANKELISVARIKTIAIYILMVLLSAIWQRIYDYPSLAESSLGDFFTNSAEKYNGGGIIGALICKALSPIGFWGSMVVLVILLVICIIVITEKSFINGIRNVKTSSKRIVETARQDYDEYKEHSAEKMEINEQRAKEKQQRQDERRRARMENKALGVTLDTKLSEKQHEVENININDVNVETERYDEFSDDIYNPGEHQYEGKYPDVDANIDVSVDNESDFRENAGLEVSWETDLSVVGESDDYNSDYYMQHNSVQDENYDNQGNADEKVNETVSEKAEEKNETINGNIGNEAVVNNTADIEKKHEYKFPPLSLLNMNKNAKSGNQARENQTTAMRLQQTLQNFGVKVTIIDISCGPSVTRYELQPEQGVKVSKIVSLSDDIKLNLAAADIRIEAPIPGKAAIGIEVPNKKPGSVGIRELFESDAFKNHPSAIAFAAGKDIAGKPIIADIAKMPHLLIAGATGSGKSVCINTIIMSIIYRANPQDVKLIMIDPKVVELSVYNPIPHLMIPVVTDPKKASGALNWAVAEMDARYKKFAKMNVRDLKGYNSKVSNMKPSEGEEIPQKMPQIVIIIDELADLMMVAPGEVEDSICRLAQLARAAGIHLVIATQRPSVNVITGLIKANVPSRIAFSVSSGVDSRTIIDMNGAEKLLGKGDMLFFPSGYPKPVRVQGAFVSDEEVSRVVEFLKENSNEKDNTQEQMADVITSTVSQSVRTTENERDSYFAQAGRFVIEKEKGSIGMLQRYYKIGFNRAGRIMDQLADAGVVGPELGTKPRKVLMTLEEFEDYLRNNN